MSKISAQMLKAAKDELRRREERAALKADCEKDLMAFVEAFWPVVEPATPLIKGWVLETMCDVLMAAADGHLHRICINVPPGSMKSTMLNVFYPAWLWGAQNRPHLRFISASYSTMIPERDNARLLRVIQSDLFRQFWGDRVQVVREGVGLVETSATGWKRVVSTGGGTTGHRGDYVLCLERSARILTNQGEMAVGDIVDERREVLVAGWSGNGVRWQKIECYEVNPPGAMVRLNYANRSLTCTGDHPIWVESNGFVPAESVRPGDILKGARLDKLEASEDIAVCSVDVIGETGEPTYNLRVGPDHNYFVEGILAHNCDDLNDPNNVESETIRAATSHWLREVMPDRVNNLKTSVIINIQQRTHEQDATGVLLQFGYTHIVVPMEFDPGRFRHVVLRRNKSGEATQMWADPRGLDKDGNELLGLVEKAHGALEAEPGSPMAQAEGTLCWPERYPEDEMEKMKNIKGPYAWAAQYLQLPTVRGGAIIRREWWRRWRGVVLPEFGTVIASLDTAIKEGTENDYNALTILGAFADDEGAPQFMLADAWRVRTNLADLVRMVGEACRKHSVDYLLIEDKARGHDVAAEIRRLYASSPWDTLLLKIGGGRYAQDKVTRVMAITPMFSGPVRKDPATGLDIWDGGMFWAPETDWAEEVIAETTSFPRGAHDDYCDCLAQAALWARKTGLAITKAEYRESEDDAMQYHPPVGVPYAIHGPADA
jgi:phage terminase large subunit-like protein